MFLHVRQQATACVVIACKLRDVDGKPPGIPIPKHGFPHVQDVVDDGACKSASDFNTKFVGVVAKFDAYHSVIPLGELFGLTDSAYSNSA